MMRYLAGFLALLQIWALGGCKEKQGRRERDPLFGQAFEIHEKSRERYKSVAKIRTIVMDSCKGDSIIEALPGDSASMGAGGSYARSLHELDSLTRSWVETFTEVPGIQDYEKHHPDHQHGPSIIKNLEPGQVLAIQQIHYEELDSLALRWENLVLEHTSLAKCSQDWPPELMQKLSKQ